VTGGSLGTPVRIGDVMARIYPAFAVAAVVTFLVLAREMTFRSDDWDLVARRSLTDPLGLMRPFNEQWILVPAAIFRVIYLVVGMHSYLPYLVVLLLFHVVVAEAVRRLVTSCSGALVGYLAATVVLFLGTGAENLRWAVQISMVCSTAAGLWAMLIVLRGDKLPVVAALLLVSVASHAIGAAFLGACIVMSIVGNRRALPWLAVPTVALAAWFLFFDLPAMSARSGSLASGVAYVPSFVVAGIATAAGSVFALSTSGGIIILAVLAVAAVRFRRRPKSPLLIVGSLVALALEYSLVAISRSDYGISSVAWSRYVYVAIPLLLVGLAGWFGPPADLAPRRRPRLTAALVLLTAVAVVANLRFYVGAGETDLASAHRARATVSVAAWSIEVRRPASDVHIPDPADLRTLVAADGSPNRDDLFPFIVPTVPDDIARAICEEMLIDKADLALCRQAIADRVGGR
jgi:hypothetical protein